MMGYWQEEHGGIKEYLLNGLADTWQVAWTMLIPIFSFVGGLMYLTMVQPSWLIIPYILIGTPVILLLGVHLTEYSIYRDRRKQTNGREAK